MAQVKAPFTAQQVLSLNDFQKMQMLNPVVCPNVHTGDHVLVATEDGWHCPAGDYHLETAEDYMFVPDSPERATISQLMLSTGRYFLSRRQDHNILMPTI